MDVTVVIPFSGTDPDRLAARAWTMRQYTTHHRGWRIATSAPGTLEPWSKGAAVRRILDAVDPQGVLVIADADVFCPGIEVAVGYVQHSRRPAWAMPHNLVCRFNQKATDRILSGAKAWTQMQDGNLDQGLYKGFEGGGITVLNRETYENVPLDSRFTGFGQEDEAWGLALRTLVGAPGQGGNVLYHLWHPPQQRLDRRWGSEESKTRMAEYEAAAGDKERMRNLLAEANVTP